MTTFNKITESKRQEAIKVMELAQEKTINKQPLTDLEKQLQDLDFKYGKSNGAKEAVKRGLI